MRTRNLEILFLALLLLICAASSWGAVNTVQLTASRSAIMADGKQSTELTAYVRDSSGRPVGNNIDVQFQTSAGTLSSVRVPTFSGVARVRLTSSTIATTANVTAFVGGGGSDLIQILFTNDAEATFEGNTYVIIQGSGYALYSATDKVVEAQGKNGGARLTYRNMEITADRMQLHCEDNIVRARDNIVIKRGKNVIQCSRLYYSLLTGQGYAIAEENNRLRPVVISGLNLHMEPSPTPIPTSYMMLPALQVKLTIVSRGITYFPSDKLQFRRPKFYQDSQLIMSLPYYEMSLYSQELFSDQFVSVGTSGFGLELPFYFNLTPRSTGIVYLRHQQQIGRGYYATDPGWAVDVLQGYSAQGSHRYEGAFGFTGLTRSNWGFRWSHSQEFNPDTQGSFYLDFPNHNGIYSSGNFSQQMRSIRWGMNLAAGQDFSEFTNRTVSSSVYVETQPRRLTKNTMMTVGTTVTSNSFQSPTLNFHETTENISARAFSQPSRLDKYTTLTPSLTVGHLWSSTGTEGPLGMATLALDRTLRGGGSFNLTYDVVYQPKTYDSGSGNNRLSLNYNVVNTRRFRASIFGSTYLDSSDASLLADASYRLNSYWRLLGSATLQTFAGVSYQDLEFSIGRRLGARELQFTYSTFNKRFSVDLTATRF